MGHVGRGWTGPLGKIGSICRKIICIKIDHIAGEDFQSVGIDVQDALGVVFELAESLVAFDKVAVEVVGLASIIACDGAFVVVGNEVTNGTNIAFAGCCVLRTDGQRGEETDVGCVREIRAEKIGIRRWQNVFQVGGHHLQSRPRLAVSLDLVFRAAPEACGILDDVQKDHKNDR